MPRAGGNGRVPSPGNRSHLFAGGRGRRANHPLEMCIRDSGRAFRAGGGPSEEGDDLEADLDFLRNSDGVYA